MRRGPRPPLAELAPYLLSVPRSLDPALPEETPTFLHWPTIFGNDRPVELEVGFGKGLFLVTSAKARPHVNFVGVEIVRKYQLYTATRLATNGLSNVRLACGDVRLLFPRHVPSESLQAVHVYFPDPWWKHRHHKRRVFTAEFVAQCVRILRPGGQLHAATDVPAYAELMSSLFARQPNLRTMPSPPDHEPTHDLDYLTHFERKFRKQGKPIFHFRYERP